MADQEPESAHRIPAIERMMTILIELEKNPAGLGLKRLAEKTGVTRSTVYRILNSLEAHRMVRQVDGSAYILGSRFLSFAAHVTAEPIAVDLPRIAQPHLDLLASTLGESCKLAVYDRGMTLVVAATPGASAHALHAPIGQHLPIHAGGASKAIMAHLPEEEVRSLLGRKLKKYTDKTITDPVELVLELEKVRRQGWSHDPGEFSVSVNSFGAPVMSTGGKVIAGLSIPFLAGRDAQYQEQVREAAIRTAIAIGSEIEFLD